MPLTSEDRLAIADLVALHGHLFDEGELDRLTLAAGKLLLRPLPNLSTTRRPRPSLITKMATRRVTT